MYFCVMAWLVGATSLRWLWVLPSLFYLLMVILVLGAAWYFSPKRIKPVILFILVALISLTWGIWHAQRILSWHLPDTLEGKPVVMRGYISSLPQIERHYAQFEFHLTQLNGQPQSAKLRLMWYHLPQVKLQVGDEWQLQARLKKPHGLVNPGGFDYEQWLFANGIRATGSVLRSASNRLIGHNVWRYPINRCRQHLQETIRQYLSQQPTAGLITALVMGAQAGISQTQWQIMRATGTNHLMAIAGVHIGFVAGFIYVIAQWLWRCFPFLLLKVPAHLAAALAAFVAALGYSALAGFSLPTQRALIMLAVVLWGLWSRRELAPWNAWFLALWLVLIWDPLAVLSVSFWLSFGAVAAILYGIAGRLRPGGWWWKYGRVQWVISLGLMPLSLLLFQQASLISLFANLIAVPAVGFLVLPLCLSGTLLLLIYQPIGYGLLWGSAKVIAGIWQLLAWFAQLHGAVWEQGMPNVWVLAATVIGIAWLLAPRGLPGRCFGLLWLCPIIFYQAPAPKKGELRFTLLDVGQGLASVVQTAEHSLVFDAGPPMGAWDDAAQRVIMPFLRSSGIRRIDQLVISHGDSDHKGGANSLLQSTPVAQILTSVPEQFATFLAQVCRSGQHWEWDGVDFRVLYPPAELLHQNNNSSCVLRIQSGKTVLLLTGDIEKSAEEFLVRTHVPLAADILVAPHHGSKTSSTPDFVHEVNPRYVLFPVGYKNRYHFPSRIVVKRYEKINSIGLNTADSGAITVNIKAGDKVEVKQYRKERRRFWY